MNGLGFVPDLKFWVDAKVSSIGLKHRCLVFLLLEEAEHVGRHLYELVFFSDAVFVGFEDGIPLTIWR